jgi:catechol 2,3-dioxygenase-like lactoylglutathione lyase family enzyme
MIAHIILSVKDFSVSERFYDLILGEIGFTVDFKDEGHKESAKSYRKGQHNLWIKHINNREHLPFVRDVGLDHVAFSVESRDEVDKLYNLIKRTGVEVTREPSNYPEYTEKYYAFYFRDPNGIPLEICIM